MGKTIWKAGATKTVETNRINSGDFSATQKTEAVAVR